MKIGFFSSFLGGFFMKLLKKRTLTATALLLATLLASPLFAMPPVVQEVPDDAAGAIVLSNLKDFSTKLSNTATRLNIPAPPDILALVSQQLGITKGLDANGSAAFVAVMPVAADPDTPIKPLYVLLLPATDSTLLLEPFKPSAPEKGISTVTLPNENEDQGFVAVIGKEGKFVAFAQEKSALELYLARKNDLTKKLAPDSVKAFDANDLVMYTNMAQVSPALTKQMDFFKQMMGGMLSMAGRDQATAAAQERMFGLYIDGLKQVFTDANTALITFRLNDTGATLGFQGQFKADTPTGKFVAAQKAANPPSLQGLPGGTILAAGDMAWDPASMANIITKISNAVIDTPEMAKDPQFEPARKAAVIQKQMIAITNGVRFAFYEPPANTKGFFHGLTLVDTTDPAKYLALFQESAKLNFGGVNPSNPDLRMVVTVKEKALTIGTTTFNEYTLKFQTQPETPEEPLREETKKALEIIHVMYGPDGITMYTAPVDKYALVTVGIDKPMIEKALTALQNKSTELAQDPAVAPVMNQVVAIPTMVTYLPVARWITLAQREFDGKTATTAPVAGAVVGAGEPGAMVISGGVAGPNATVEIHMPMTAMSAIAEAIQRAEAGRMGQ